MRTRRLAAVLAAGALIVGMAACDDGEEPGGPGSGPEGTSGETDDGERVTLPPEFLECGEPDDLNAEDGLLLSSIDLTQARWDTPSGFQQTFRYHEDNPVEREVSLWVAEPIDDPVVLNVVNVIIYADLDWGELADECDRVPIEAIEARLAQYREQIGAEPMSDAEMTLLAGHPAITQQIGLPDYEYVGYWLFSTDQLLHLYCQWTVDRELIEAACAELVESLEVG